MAQRHSRISAVPDYLPLHISAEGTVVPVGNAIATTSSTTIAVGTMAVEPVVLTGILPGMTLNIANGTGTSEDVLVENVSAVDGTFTATFKYAHSGAYTIIGRRGTFLGRVTINQPGTNTTITLYNGHPDMDPAPTSADFGVIAIIIPDTYTDSIEFGCACDYGLFYTVESTGEVGDYTIMYIDMIA